MTRRATARGAQRTSLDGTRADVLICGASFAGLAVARELAGCGADVLLIDRYAIGERQTSACAVPEGWLKTMGAERSLRAVLPDMTFTTPHGTRALPAAVALGRLRLPHAVRGRVRAVRRALRDREGRRPHAASPCTPTAATCTRR